MNINGGGRIVNYSAFSLMENRSNFFETVSKMELRNKREK
jgi:hypothetical protein